MTITSENIILTGDDYHELYADSGKVPGTPVTVQNTGVSDLYYAIVTAKPDRDNNAYRILRRGDIVTFDQGDLDVWFRSPCVDGEYNVGVIPSVGKFEKTAFGELAVESKTPIVQISAQYGIQPDTVAASSNGTVGVQDSNFVLTSGTDPNGVSAIYTKQQLQYRAGQGTECSITALFSPGVAGSTQLAGLVSSDCGLAFGYDGENFGIVRYRNGSLEIQRLTLTVAAAGATNATVTVAGVAFSIPLTVSTINQNAYEIAAYLKANDPRFNYRSTGAVVTAVGNLPNFGGPGAVFAFTHATAVGSWSQVAEARAPDEFWTYKDQWNVRPDIDIDPNMGNVYRIKMQYLGYGNSEYYVEDPQTGDLVLVHTDRYVNRNVVPSVNNPIFRIGWVIRNTGNTTDLTLKGASAAGFIEGMVLPDATPRGLFAAQTGVGLTRTNIVSFRNRDDYKNQLNKLSIIPQLLSFSTDSAKFAVFEVVVNPVPTAGQFINWQYLDQANSLMEYASNNYTLASGIVVATFVVDATGSRDIDISKLVKQHYPSDYYSIAARITTGAASQMAVSGVWLEDI